MTPVDLIREIGLGKFRPVYYFYGDEDFRKREAIKYLLTNYLPQQLRLLNYTQLAIDKNDFETICREVATIPMLGERRLVVVDEIQKLKGDQQKRFFAFLANPNPETVVILTSPAARTPQYKSAFLTQVAKIAESIKFDPLTEDAAKGRISKVLENAGLTYDREALELLYQLTGEDFGGLTAELEKLTISMDQGGHVGLAEVKQLVSSHEEYTQFEVIDLITSGRRDKALLAYNDLVQKGMSPASFVTFLAGRMTDLLKIHTGKNVDAKPFYVNNLRRQARSFAVSKVLAAFSLIADADRKIRRSEAASDVVVENLIRQISGQEFGRKQG
jgi:DNA polymerase-3 subunit delta